MGEERPARKHRRRVVALVSGFLMLALLTVVMMPNSSPVGHWDGREGHERFVRACTEAFQEMPEPEETLDVRTDHGSAPVRRLHRSRTPAGVVAGPCVRVTGVGRQPALLAGGR